MRCIYIIVVYLNASQYLISGILGILSYFQPAHRLNARFLVSDCNDIKFANFSVWPPLKNGTGGFIDSFRVGGGGIKPIETKKSVCRRMQSSSIPSFLHSLHNMGMNTCIHAHMHTYTAAQLHSLAFFDTAKVALRPPQKHPLDLAKGKRKPARYTNTSLDVFLCTIILLPCTQAFVRMPFFALKALTLTCDYVCIWGYSQIAYYYLLLLLLLTIKNIYVTTQCNKYTFNGTLCSM